MQANWRALYSRDLRSNWDFLCPELLISSVKGELALFTAEILAKGTKVVASWSSLHVFFLVFFFTDSVCVAMNAEILMFRASLRNRTAVKMGELVRHYANVVALLLSRLYAVFFSWNGPRVGTST